MAEPMRQTLRDETFDDAAELARLQGATVEDSVAQAVRSALAVARRTAFQREQATADVREERDRNARAWLARWHGLLSDPPPLSNHDWLYDDETGLPV